MIDAWPRIVAVIATNRIADNTELLMSLSHSDLIIDEEFKSTLPAPSDQERSDLLSNIIADGQVNDAIIVWLGHNIIVDGMTRFELWKEHLSQDDNFPPLEIIERHFADRAAVKQWIKLHALGRRNLTDSQRALLLAEARHEKPRSQDSQSCVTQAEAAKEFGISDRLLTKANKVHESGSKPLQDAVRDGEVTVSDAAKVADLPKRQQNIAVNRVKQGKAKTVASAVQASPIDPTDQEDGPERGAATKNPPRVTSNGNLGIFDAADQKRWRDSYGVLHRLTSEFKKRSRDIAAFQEIDGHLAAFFDSWTKHVKGGKWH